MKSPLMRRPTVIPFSFESDTCVRWALETRFMRTGYTCRQLRVEQTNPVSGRIKQRA